MDQSCTQVSNKPGEVLLDRWEITGKDIKDVPEELDLADEDYEITSFVIFQPEEYKIAYSEKVPRTPEQIECIIHKHLKIKGESISNILVATINSRCGKCGLKMIEMGGKFICFQCGTL